jgi:hypothetical protein
MSRGTVPAPILLYLANALWASTLPGPMCLFRVGPYRYVPPTGPLPAVVDQCLAVPSPHLLLYLPQCQLCYTADRVMCSPVTVNNQAILISDQT